MAAPQNMSFEELAAQYHLTPEQLAQRIATDPASTPYPIKVSEKGAISVYGIRRFPITFYYSEWETLFSLVEEIMTFADAHRDELSNKGE